jgi:hypothetical protein
MRIMALACALTILFGGAGAAESSRDDWKPGRDHHANEDLAYSLATAPFLTTGDRDGIARVIEDQEDEERKTPKTLMSYRVGLIGLAQDGSNQVLVQAPDSLCGNGGCDYWIFIRRHRQLQLVLKWFGFALVRDTFSHGFRDVVFEYHSSALEEDYTVYRWNGEKYEEIDCYSSKGGVTTDCGYKPTMHH